MTDPVVNGTIATATQSFFGSILYKVLVYFIGPITAALVVMFMSQPNSAREWFSAMISTVMSSIGLGSLVITRWLIVDPFSGEFAAMQAGAVFFVCGLPGWFFVRVLFYTFEENQNTNIFELWKKIRNMK